MKGTCNGPLYSPLSGAVDHNPCEPFTIVGPTSPILMWTPIKSKTIFVGHFSVLTKIRKVNLTAQNYSIDAKNSLFSCRSFTKYKEKNQSICICELILPSYQHISILIPAVGSLSHPRNQNHTIPISQWPVFSND